jgi:hypothetical protein
MSSVSNSSLSESSQHLTTMIKPRSVLPVPEDRQSRSQRSIQSLTTWIIVITLVGYPLFGTLVAFTDLSSLVASLPVRAAILILSLMLLFRARLVPRDTAATVMYLFWILYLFRLLWDLLTTSLPVVEGLVFFIFTCLVPALALAQTTQRWPDEDGLSRRLLLFGLVTCAISAAPSYLGLGVARSLLEDTGRLSFDTVNPITFGHVAVTTIIAALAQFRSRMKTSEMTLLIAGFFVALSSLNLAASRGPVVALVVCLTALSLTQKRFRYVALISAAFIAVWMIYGTGGELEQRILGVDDDPSTLIRLSLQANAIQQFLENPLLGSAFVELTELTYPHNPILESAMALGVGGLVLIVTLMAITVWRLARLLQSGLVVIPLIALQSLIAAQFSGSLWGSNPMWMGVALAISVTKRPAAPASRSPKLRRSAIIGPGPGNHRLRTK